MRLIDDERNKCFVFPPEENAERGDDYVQAVGYQKVLPNESYPLGGFPKKTLFEDDRGRTVDAFQLVFIMDGKGYFLDRGIRYEVSKGALMLIRPGIWHSYKPARETGWTEFFVAFDGEMMTRVIADAFPSDSSNVYQVNDVENVAEIFRKALELAREDTADTMLFLKALLSLLLSKVVFSGSMNPKDGRNTTKLVAKARSYMEKNIHKKIDMNEIADMLGVSYTSFAVAFKNQTGESPVRFLRKLRLQKARYELHNTNMSIKQIALDCGFSSSEYFCHFFREEIGETPSVFRERQKQYRDARLQD